MSHFKVVFLSNWWDNPYKEMLINNLISKNIHVEKYNFSLIFLPQILKQGKIDIVHLHILQPFFIDSRSKIYTFTKFLIFIVQLFTLKLIGVKVVWTAHELNDPKLYVAGNISPISARIIGNFLNAIITHCESIKSEISTLFSLNNQNKLFVIPHGNYIDYYENKVSQSEARKALGISDETLVFLFFGSIYRHKGILELIDTFKQLQQNEVYLMIAGDPKESQLKELIIEKIQGYENILFEPKSVPDDKIQVYMNACDCVVVPYKEFTTSGVAILAMSYGRACIAPRIGFFNDVLDDSGAFLYDSTNEEGLLHAMKCAIEKKNNILDMGKHNLKLVEQWNWDYVSERTLNVYQWCLGRFESIASCQFPGEAEVGSIYRYK